MNADIEQTVKGYQCTQPLEAALHYDILCKLWKIVGANVKTLFVL